MKTALFTSILLLVLTIHVMAAPYVGEGPVKASLEATSEESVEVEIDSTEVIVDQASSNKTIILWLGLISLTFGMIAYKEYSDSRNQAA